MLRVESSDFEVLMRAVRDSPWILASFIPVVSLVLFVVWVCTKGPAAKIYGWVGASLSIALLGYVGYMLNGVRALTELTQVVDIGFYAFVASLVLAVILLLRKR